MPDCSAATRASVDAAARDLSGSLIASVTYFGFSHEHENWDRGRYHQAVMGVGLTCPDGREFVACWGDAFGHFGLELIAGAPDDIFLNVPETRDFSGHPWWAPFTRSAVSARIDWRTGHVDRTADEPDEPAPVAVTLRSGNHCVWVAAARREDTSGMSRGGFILGADAVLVTAHQEFAHSIGLGNSQSS